MDNNPMLTKVQYWLVNHPIIYNFKWIQGETFGSTIQFLITSLIIYLLVVVLQPLFPLPNIQSQSLKPIKILHNLICVVLSILMACGCILSILSQAPNIHWVVCLPLNTPPNGPIFFWAYIFYFSKFIEFNDTILIILGGSKRLSFLHVYHHTSVVILCYIWLETSQSMFPVMLVINSTVHVLMYGYYFLCSIGMPPKWKRFVTECQIMQFRLSFAVMAPLFYYHFTGSGCCGVWSWWFNMFFFSTLLALFLDFHSRAYGTKKTSKKIKEGRNKDI